jgi:hypothetical protein
MAAQKLAVGGKAAGCEHDRAIAGERGDRVTQPDVTGRPHERLGQHRGVEALSDR